MSKVVLDASALLALVQGEPGAEKVRPLIPHAAMSAVNFCETVQRLRRGGMPVESVTMMLTPLVPEPVAFDRETAYIAASIHEEDTRAGDLIWRLCLPRPGDDAWRASGDGGAEVG